MALELTAPLLLCFPSTEVQTLIRICQWLLGWWMGGLAQDVESVVLTGLSGGEYWLGVMLSVGGVGNGRCIGRMGCMFVVFHGDNLELV